MSAATVDNAVSAYFGRPAERLVLEGFRHWKSGAAGTGRSAKAGTLYAEILGVENGRHVLDALESFAETLTRCAACPMRVLPLHMQRINREETLVVGLVAGLQHGDDAAVRACLDALTCPSRCVEVELAAARFAMALKSTRHVLVPVPHIVVEDILYRAARPTRH